MEVENFETSDISTKIYEGIKDGKDIEGVGVHFFLLEFVHNPSILKIKIFSKKKTDFSVPPHGFLWWTRFDEFEPNVI